MRMATFTTCILFALTCVFGCEEESKHADYVDAVVLAEAGTITEQCATIEQSRGALFGNESIRFTERTYALRFRTGTGVDYTCQILPWRQDGIHTLDALNLAISTGTRIRIKQSRLSSWQHGTVCMLRDFDIEVQ